LPSLEELRAATRAATRDATAEADSIADAERELGRRTGDLAQQRSRDETAARRGTEAGRESALPFQATERAQAVAREQEARQARRGRGHARVAGGRCGAAAASPGGVER